MSQKSHVWLIRHGETEWSLSGQHSGRVDLPLTAHGEKEAMATRALLQQRPFDLVLCSTLQRAKRTCEIAGYLNVAQLEPDIMEWDYGDCTGFTQAQIREKYPNWTIWDGPVPNGESIDDIAARARRVIAKIKDYSSVALFAHGHFLRIFATQYLEIQPQYGSRLALETASLSVLGHDQGYPAIIEWNRK